MIEECLIDNSMNFPIVCESSIKRQA